MRLESSFQSHCNDPQNYRRKWKQVRTKSSISAFTTCERSLSSSFIQPSFNKLLTKDPLCTKTWGCKTASKTDTDHPELFFLFLRARAQRHSPQEHPPRGLVPHNLSFLMTHNPTVPSSTEDQELNTYHCQPVEQWLQPQAMVYS